MDASRVPLFYVPWMVGYISNNDECKIKITGGYNTVQGAQLPSRGRVKYR